MMKTRILRHSYRYAAATLAPLALTAMAGAASAQTPPEAPPPAALAAPTQAPGATLSPEQIVKRHMSAKGNIDTIMADYADDAVLLQNGRAVIGKPAIRAQFEKLFAKPPAGAAAGASPSPMAGMQVKRIWQQGNVGFLTWEMGPIHATEEFVVHHGKIAVQAIFMHGQGMPPATGK